MDQLPDEIILHILSLIATGEWQLLELEKVSKKLQRIISDQTLWYQLFQQNYKNWGYHVPYTSFEPLINWKSFVIHLAKQKQRSRSFTFDFVSDEISSTVDPLISRKRKLHELGRSSSSPSPPSLLKNQSRQQEPTSFMDTTEGQQHRLYHFGNQSTDSINTPMRMETVDDTPMLSPPRLRLRPRLPSLLSAMDEEPSFDRATLRSLFDRPPMRFHIQDPLVVDLNRMTKTGMVATGKHRKATVSGVKQSEHKILFWEYPSWRLVRELELAFVPPEITCQVIGVQTIRIKKPPGDHHDNKTPPYQSIRLFALAIGQPIVLHDHIHPDLEDPDANDDRVELWQAVLIYRLFDDGTTHCLAHVPFDGRFMGREVFFFSDYSWTFGDSDDTSDKQRNVKDWLDIVAPDHTNYDPHFTLFMLAIGPVTTYDGCGKLIQFDLRGDTIVMDPALSSVPVNPTVARRPIVIRRETAPLSPHPHLQNPSYYPRYSHDRTQQSNNTASMPLPAKIIHSIHLGSNVSCMIHFRYPSLLNHLICTGSNNDNELSIYDWRFGVKVGTLPWKEEKHQQQQSQAQQQRPPPQQPQNIEENHPHQQPQEQLHQDIEQHHPQDQDNLILEEANLLQPRLAQLLRMNRRGDFDHLAGEGGRAEFARRLEETIRLIDQHAQQHMNEDNDNDDDDDDDDDNDDLVGLDSRLEVRPWGLESTMVLPPHWGEQYDPTSGSSGSDMAALADRGFRLIAVGDNRLNRLEIKVWDISFLLQQTWDPLLARSTQDGSDDQWQDKAGWSIMFPWWYRGTPSLRLLGLRMAYERAQWDERRYATSSVPFEIRRLLKHDTALQRRATQVPWPFTAPRHHRTMLLAHAFDKPTPTAPTDENHPMGSIMTVKYTAYNVLCTSLFLLTEDGKVTVLDIETGEVTGTIDNVAATPNGRRLATPTGRIRGIDVNVVAGREVVVTSREGILRSVMS